MQRPLSLVTTSLKALARSFQRFVVLTNGWSDSRTQSYLTDLTLAFQRPKFLLGARKLYFLGTTCHTALKSWRKTHFDRDFACVYALNCCARSRDAQQSLHTPCPTPPLDRPYYQTSSKLLIYYIVYTHDSRYSIRVIDSISPSSGRQPVCPHCHTHSRSTT